MGTVTVLQVCKCHNAEDENYTPGHVCCDCGAFFKITVPLSAPQRCQCGHVRGTVRVELPKPVVRGWDRIWKRLEEAFAGNPPKAQP